MNKKKYIIVTISIIALILIALLLFRLFGSRDSKSSSINEREKLYGVYITDGVVEKSAFSIDNKKCTTGHICIQKMVFHYYGDKGTIRYTIHNESDTEKSGYVLIKIEDTSFLLRYQNLSEDEEQDGIYGYEGFSFDFSSIDYEVYDATAEDLEAIYHNDSCIEQEDHSYVC